jgi:hypothetical protein
MEKCQDVVSTLKQLVAKFSLEGIKEYLLIIDDELHSYSTDYIFQKVYLHTCLLIGKYKKKKDEISVNKLLQIEQFLKLECFPKLPEIQRIAIRHCFNYGKCLMQ